MEGFTQNNDKNGGSERGSKMVEYGCTSKTEKGK